MSIFFKNWEVIKFNDFGDYMWSRQIKLNAVVAQHQRYGI